MATSKCLRLTSDIHKKGSVPFVSLKSFGWPDPDLFQKTLYHFLLNNRDKYLYNLSCDDPDATKYCELAVTTLHAQMGSYDDAMRGIRNIFQKLRAMVYLPNADQWTGNADDWCMFVAAGPSLDKDIDYIKKYQHNATIFAVDAVFKRLVSEGVEPDFVITTERFDVTAEFFLGGLDTTATLIFTPAACQTCIDAFKGKKGWFRIEQQPLDSLPLRFPKFLCGVSVSPTMLGVATTMGFKKFVMIGQDLCFDIEGGKTHASGVPVTRPKRTVEEF